MFVGFMPEGSPESSFKGETTFMLFVWKEFFTYAQFKSTSEDTHWCERRFKVLYYLSHTQSYRV